MAPQEELASVCCSPEQTAGTSPYVFTLGCESRYVSRKSLFQSPANYFSDTALQEHWRTFDFPSRRIRRRPPQDDVDAFVAKCTELRRSAAEQEQLTPASYVLENSWTATLRADKRYYLDNTLLRTT